MLLLVTSNNLCELDKRFTIRLVSVVRCEGCPLGKIMQLMNGFAERDNLKIGCYIYKPFCGLHSNPRSIIARCFVNLVIKLSSQPLEVPQVTTDSLNPTLGHKTTAVLR